MRKTLLTNGRQRFTLIELLLVVAVIAMLTAMLLPALGHARERARGGACFGNLRQTALLHQMYTGDHDGVFPGGSTNSGASTWYVVIARALGEPEVAHNNPVTLANQRRYSCPVITERWTQEAKGSGGGSIAGFAQYQNYGTGMALSQSDGSCRFLAIVKRAARPSLTMLAADAMGADSRAGFYNLRGTQASVNGQFSLVHLGQGNMMFLDGHAESGTGAKFRGSGVIIPKNRSDNLVDYQEETLDYEYIPNLGFQRGL